MRNIGSRAGVPAISKRRQHIVQSSGLRTHAHVTYSAIRHPYPKTKYCDVPAEAQTGVPLCRPLPKDTFTPPPPRPRPTGKFLSPVSQEVPVVDLCVVVGSAEWIHSRSTNVSSEAPSSSRRRRGNHGSQIAPSDSVSMISSSISEMGAQASAPPRIVSQWLADQRAKQPVCMYLL